VARGTDLGKRARAAMDAGELVTDEIVLGLIRERLGRPDAAQGFILDGYPRNVAQAGALDKLLADLGQPIDAVVLMKVDESALVQRLTGRRSCPACGKVFNVYSSPSGKGERCDNPEHGAEAPLLKQRDDDKAEVIGNRLKVYNAQTAPLIEHYQVRGLLRIERLLQASAASSFSPTTFLRHPRMTGLSPGALEPNAIASMSLRVASSSAPIPSSVATSRTIFSRPAA